MYDNHKLCPRAAPNKHDTEGFVDPDIFFDAIMKVSDTEPLLVDWIREKTREQLERQERSMRRHRLERYIRAKQNGNCCNLTLSYAS